MARAPGQPGRGQLGEHLVNLARARYSWPLRLIQGPRTRARFPEQLRQLARATGARRKKTGQGPVLTGQLARLIGQVNLHLGLRPRLQTAPPHPRQGSCKLVLACRDSIGQVIRVITGQDSWPVGPGRIWTTDDCVVFTTIAVMAYSQRVTPMRANVNGSAHIQTLLLVRLARLGPGPTIDVTTQ
jgi:hypothetical protein